MSNCRLPAVDGSPALRYGGGLVCYKTLHRNGQWSNNCWDYIGTKQKQNYQKNGLDKNKYRTGVCKSALQVWFGPVWQSSIYKIKIALNVFILNYMTILRRMCWQ